MPGKSVDNVFDSSKLIYRPAEVQQFMDLGRRRAPLQIDLALTTSCQYQCQYCYARLQKNPGRTPTWAHLRRFLLDCHELGVKAIALTGDGESTLHPSFVAFVETAADLGLAVGLATNGHLMTRAVLDQVLPRLNWLQFNISAGTPETYAQVHGVTTRHFHEVCTNVRQAVEKKRQDALGTTILTQMVLRPQDAKNVPAYCSLARAMGVDYARIKHCSDNPKIDKGLGVAYDGYDKIEPVLREAEATSTKKTKVAIKWSKMRDGSTRPYTRCVGGQFLLQISGTGLVAPCGMLFEERFKEFHLGNITETGLTEIVNSAKYARVMAHLDSDDFNIGAVCGFLCVQHDANKYIDAIRKGAPIPECPVERPVNWMFV